MRTLIPGFTTRLEYPPTDGLPVAETDFHIDALLDLRARLKVWAATQQDVYAAGNMIVYYHEGEPHIHLAPDCFVAFGVPNRDRETFRTWEEGVVPSVVFEITSRTTRRADTQAKREVYQDTWGVEEYFLFDPLREYLDPSLQGFRRVRRRFQPIRPTKDGSIVSRRLGVTLSRAGRLLRLQDTTTGETILTPDERSAAEERRQREQAERRAAKSDAEKDQLAAEIARLQAELAALKKKK